MRRCVWSRNLKNEEAMARIGPQRQKKNLRGKELKYLPGYPEIFFMVFLILSRKFP